MPGFASCTTADSCETGTNFDGANCGGCGNACDPGAVCSNGTCGSAPAVLAPLSDTGGGGGPGVTLAANGTVVAWSTSGSQAILAVPPSGGTPFTIAMSATNGAPTVPFAIDSTYVYNCETGSGGGAAIFKQRIPSFSGSGSGSGSGTGGAPVSSPRTPTRAARRGSPSMGTVSTSSRRATMAATTPAVGRCGACPSAAAHPRRWAPHGRARTTSCSAPRRSTSPSARTTAPVFPRASLSREGRSRP